jgi:hypothetical protein
MKRILPLAALLSSIIASCCKADYPIFQLRILDDNKVNLINSSSTSDSTWKWDPQSSNIPSSIKIVAGNYGDALEINSNNLESARDYLIQVEPGDLDTIALTYETKGSNCSVKMNVENIKYNGVNYPFEKNESDFVVNK